MYIISVGIYIQLYIEKISFFRKGGGAIIGSPGAHAVIPIFVMNHNDHMHG